MSGEHLPSIVIMCTKILPPYVKNCASNLIHKVSDTAKQTEPFGKFTISISNFAIYGLKINIKVKTYYYLEEYDLEEAHL